MTTEDKKKLKIAEIKLQQWESIAESRFIEKQMWESQCEKMSQTILEQNSKLMMARAAIEAILKLTDKTVKGVKRIKNLLGDDLCKIGGDEPLERLEKTHQKRKENTIRNNYGV